MFIIFSIIGIDGLRRTCKREARRLDEENATASTWPRPSHNTSTVGANATPKPQASKRSTNGSKIKLRQKIRKAREDPPRVDEERGTEQYEPVAWRSASHRAARANFVGRVEHDAGPVVGLPDLFVQVHAYQIFEPLPPHYESITGMMQ